MEKIKRCKTKGCKHLMTSHRRVPIVKDKKTIGYNHYECKAGCGCKKYKK